MNLFLTDTQMEENCFFSAGFDVKTIEDTYYSFSLRQLLILIICTFSGYIRSGKNWFIIKGAYSVDVSLAHSHRVNKK